jgi:uncharacterized protein (TIGR03067 family)
MTAWVGPFLLGIAFVTGIALWAPSGPPLERVTADSQRSPDRDDRDRLQGTWLCASLERDGMVMHYRGAAARRIRVSFLGDMAVFEEGNAQLVGALRLDTARTPKTFDLTISRKDEKTTYPVGIYELRDDVFRLCFAFPTRERPTRFTTSPGSGRTLFVYRRLGVIPEADSQPDSTRPATAQAMASLTTRVFR